MAKSGKQTRNHPCPLCQVKGCIVACRKGRDEEAYRQLMGLFEKHPQYLLRNLTTRWLVSVTDTVCDYEEGSRSPVALLVSVLVNMEKAAWTVRATEPVGRVRRRAGKHLWDGVTPVSLGPSADVFLNMFFRMRHQVKEDPLLEPILETVVQRMMNQAGSTFSIFDRRCKRNVKRDILHASKKRINNAAYRR